MLSLEIPPFDLLKGEQQPTEVFGVPLPAGSEGQGDFSAVLRQAKERVDSGFRVELSTPDAVVRSLDGVIDQMWEDGWDPSAGDVNLFVRDFGALLLDALRRTCGGELVLRSTTDLSHASLWWEKTRVEAFPFHKVLKALARSEGESLAQFKRGVAHQL